MGKKTRSIFFFLKEKEPKRTIGQADGTSRLVYFHVYFTRKREHKTTCFLPAQNKKKTFLYIPQTFGFSLSRVPRPSLRRFLKVFSPPFALHGPLPNSRTMALSSRSAFSGLMK